MTSAGSVAAAWSASQRTGGGATPTPALQTHGPKDLVIRPIPTTVAKQVCVDKHYLHSYPGGSLLNFGVFVHQALLGVVVIGVGASNIHTYFEDARPAEVVCLARLWLDDRLGKNCESRVLGIVLRMLKRHQSTIKAIIAYSDPLAGHTGGIYRAAGFLYLGPSSSTPLYRLPDGSIHHSRSLSHAYGTHSLEHFHRHGVEVELIEQVPKLTYVALVDPTWRERLKVPAMSFPKIKSTDMD